MARGNGGGPKSPDGKAAVRKNAVKHGMRASLPLASRIEERADYEKHLDGVMQSLEPEGYLETEMAVRVAEILWRIRRIGVFEAQKINIMLDLMPQDMAMSAQYGEKALGLPHKDITVQDIDTQVGIRLLPDSENLARIMRYEAHLHRQYIQTLHELEAMQTRRKGGHTPLARLDITGAPGSS
jgi:hypothetical protein